MNASSDVSHESLWAQMQRLSKTYWIANAMEMFERLAYYGLRVVIPVYMVLAVEEGGPQFDHVQKGLIFAIWAAVQSFVPVFSGGFADRYGYRLTVAISVAIKVSGYLVMAWAVDLASLFTGGVSATVPGHPATFAFFLGGACLLALGTAVFKPGLQGIIATQVDEGNSSVAWAWFYQLVNVGGFLGPFLAGVMRLMAWRWVFISCAIIVTVNWLLLLAFPEPDKGEGAAPAEGNALQVFVDSLAGIVEPRLFAFLAVFSGFWAMFYQLFDLLPNFIDDWVDSSGIYAAVATPIFGVFGSTPPDAWGGQVPQEMMINLNAGLIMIFAFLMGAFTGRMRSMTAMVAGILVSACGILALGASMDGWVTLGAIAIFSLGEMMASPTKMRYVAGIAPPGKQGAYLGYVNATTGIGWTLGSLVAGAMYEQGGDKVVLARRHLVETGAMSSEAAEALPKTDVVPALAQHLGVDGSQVVEMLWSTYTPQWVWVWFCGVGVVSMAGLAVFDRITQRDLEPHVEERALIVLTGLTTGLCYGPLVGIAFAALMAVRAVFGNKVGGLTVASALTLWVVVTMVQSVG